MKVLRQSLDRVDLCFYLKGVLRKVPMPHLSDEQLEDIALAHSCEEILDILGIESYDLAELLRDRIEQDIFKFNLLPVDCNINDF